MKLKFLFLLFFLRFIPASAQFTDRYWTFGEHAAINFSNLSNPVPDTSRLNARGTCASICDSLGNLLFYAASPDDSVFQIPNNIQVGYVINKLHQSMQNGDSLKTSQWYQEMNIVPVPGSSHLFYVFHVGVTSTSYPGLYYSMVDMNQSNGLGDVVQKNVQLMNLPFCDGMAVTRHGNGRDWWIIFKNWDSNNNIDEFHLYLINPSGVFPMPVQHIGTPYFNGSITRLKFNKNGDRLYAIQWANLIERYDFDRCNGLLSNTLTITSRILTSPVNFRWSLAISPDESKLYVTSIYNGFGSDTSYIFQFDLNASNIALSIDTLDVIVRNGLSRPVPGMLQLGPDDKLYLSTFSEVSDCGFQWTYCDTSSFFPENMNLSVINFPDSLGTACGYQPYSFYLNGHRTYHGLPNNPNYELGKLVGSPCDTLGTVGVNEIGGKKAELFVYYDTDWQKAFINAKGLIGRRYQLKVFDASGKLLVKQNGNLTDDLFYYGLSLEGWAKGVYVVSLETEKELLSQKIIK